MILSLWSYSFLLKDVSKPLALLSSCNVAYLVRFGYGLRSASVNVKEMPSVRFCVADSSETRRITHRAKGGGCFGQINDRRTQLALFYVYKLNSAALVSYATRKLAERKTWVFLAGVKRDV